MVQVGEKATAPSKRLHPPGPRGGRAGSRGERLLLGAPVSYMLQQVTPHAGFPGVYTDSFNKHLTRCGAYG